MKEITLEWLAGMLAEALIARGVETSRDQELADLQEWSAGVKADAASEVQVRVAAALAVMDRSHYGDPEVPFAMRAALSPEVQAVEVRS